MVVSFSDLVDSLEYRRTLHQSVKYSASESYDAPALSEVPKEVVILPILSNGRRVKELPIAEKPQPTRYLSDAFVKLLEESV